MPEPTSVEEQLEHSLGQVSLYRSQVRKTLESPQGKLLVAVKQASAMLNELRTAKLPPQLYYELYNSCFDALSQLQAYLVEDHKNHHLADVYEIVQYTATVLPRLYLMITVGTAFLSTPDAPRQEVLKDMLEMSRGIQSPLRGLFLRYYLGQRTGSYLVTNTRRELEFSVQFTLTNFIEMNKLWVRYQHDGLSKNYDQRTEERKQLRTIVGSSILRLSQLDTLDLTFFGNQVLPAILDQVVQCRDQLAQEYLLDVIIQVFPAEYHLETLSIFLDRLRFLVPETSIPLILQASITRITDYAWTLEAEKLEAKRVESAMKEAAKKASIEAKTNELSVKADENEHEEASTPAATMSDTVQNSADREQQALGQENNDAQSNETQDKAGDLDDDKNPIEEATDDRDKKKEVTSITDEVAEPEESLAQSSSASQELQVEPSSASTKSEDAYTNGEDNTDEEPSIFAPIVSEYWDIIRAQKVSSGDRAMLVSRLVTLAEVAKVEVNLSELFGYIVADKVVESEEAEKLLLSLFNSETQNITSSLNLLRDFPMILSSQSKATRHKVAECVVNQFLDTRNKEKEKGATREVELAKQVLELMTLLVNSGGFDAVKMKAFITLLRFDQIDTSLELLMLTHTKMRKSGASIVQRTSSILVVSALDLLRLGPTPVEVAKILKFCNQACHDLATVGDSPLAAYRLYLTCGTAADNVGFEDAAYELFVQALSIYEEYITDSAQQVIALAICTQALQQTSVFTSENYDPLAQRCLQYGQRLMKKTDQCRALLRASHLFWDNNYADARRVEEILGRALRSADSMMDIGTSIELFLDVLDTNLYFLGNDTSTVTVGSVNGIIKLVQDNLSTAEKDGLSNESRNQPSLEDLQRRWERTRKFIEGQQEAFPRFQGLDIQKT